MYYIISYNVFSKKQTTPSDYCRPKIAYFLLGDVYDGMETSKTLDMPEKKRYKRPAFGGIRHTRRSASAEVIDREDDEMMGDTENLSPARRRPRRKKSHGQLNEFLSISSGFFA